MKAKDYNKWFIVFDGSSFFELLGYDVTEFLAEDPEVHEITEGPFEDEYELEKRCEWYNNRFID